MAEPIDSQLPYLAHSANEFGVVQSLQDHLGATAQLARALGEPIGLGELGYWAGLLHDLGKYEERFQQRIRGAAVRSPHTPHGAIVAARAQSIEVAFAVLAHHTRLRNRQELREKPAAKPEHDSDGPSYGERAMRVLEIGRGELPALAGAPPRTVGSATAGAMEGLELRTRMVLSLLVDADRLDTERHGSRQTSDARSRSWPSMGELADRVERYIRGLAWGASTGVVNEVRGEVLEAVLHEAEREPGMATLTVPTGGGKTLASLLYALRHAQAHGLCRVIVVVPFLAVIEQNALVMREALGEAEDLAEPLLLEHHSNVVDDHDAEDGPQGGAGLWRRLAAQNWDAPVVVTTSVQFFESLFSARPSRVRKLHNVGRSVVVFDEAQTFPPERLTPVLGMLEQLRREYAVSFLFCTATQPALEERGVVPSGGRWPAGSLWEVMPDPASLFRRLRRVRVEWPVDDETLSWPDLAAAMARERSALAVVNTKKQARLAYDALRVEAPDAVVRHLSARMCPAHRRDVLREIKRRLAAGERCQVASTQLVEAGVDIDFAAVFRALGPFDAIAQAAGRCNREGRLRDAAGVPALGRLVVFRPEGGDMPPGAYEQATDVTEGLLAAAGGTLDIDDPAAFVAYFDRFYNVLAVTDKDHIQAKRRALEFEQVGKDFRIIDDDTQAVLAPYGEDGAALVAAFRSATRLDRALLRRAQPYTINLYQREFEAALRAGALEQLAEGGPYAARPGSYHQEFGFDAVADSADYIV